MENKEIKEEYFRHDDINLFRKLVEMRYSFICLETSFSKSDRNKLTKYRLSTSCLSVITKFNYIYPIFLGYFYHFRALSRSYKRKLLTSSIYFRRSFSAETERERSRTKTMTKKRNVDSPSFSLSFLIFPRQDEKVRPPRNFYREYFNFLKRTKM